METTSIPAPPAVKPRRRWWLRGVLMMLTLIIVVPVGLIAYLRNSTALERAEAEAEADRTDPEWRMAPLLLARRQVPDEKNSALVINAIVGSVNKIQMPLAIKYTGIFAELPPANAQLTGPQLDLLRTHMSEAAALRSETRKLKAYPYGRFPIKIDPTFFGTIVTVSPNYQNARRVVFWLQHDAYLLAHSGNYDDAIDACRACLCVARSMGDEPLISSHLTRWSLQGETVYTLERVLGQGQATEEPLEKMQALLELEIKESNWLVALRGEKAGAEMLFGTISSGKVPFSKMVAAAPPGISTRVGDWMADNFPATLQRHYPDYLRDMTRIVEIAKLPLHDQAPKVAEWCQKRITSDNPLRSRMYGISKVYDGECRSQAYLRSAMTALACERYRLAHGSWPKSLGVLVQKKLLSAVPIDPIDGIPLRYRQDKEKIVIYSIGNDEKDDGGKIDRKHMANLPGVDIGFCLWNVAQRRQPPRAPAVLRPADGP